MGYFERARSARSKYRQSWSLRRGIPAQRASRIDLWGWPGEHGAFRATCRRVAKRAQYETVDESGPHSRYASSLCKSGDSPLSDALEDLAARGASYDRLARCARYGTSCDSPPHSRFVSSINLRICLRQTSRRVPSAIRSPGRASAMLILNM